MLKIKSTEVLKNLTRQLREIKKFPPRGRRDYSLNGVTLQAAKSAKEKNMSCYVYLGSYSTHPIYRTTFKKTDAFNGVNNTGTFVLEIAPNLEVKQHLIEGRDKGVWESTGNITVVGGTVIINTTSVTEKDIENLKEKIAKLKEKYKAAKFKYIYTKLDDLNIFTDKQLRYLHKLNLISDTDYETVKKVAGGTLIIKNMPSY